MTNRAEATPQENNPRHAQYLDRLQRIRACLRCYGPTTITRQADYDKKGKAHLSDVVTCQADGCGWSIRVHPDGTHTVLHDPRSKP